VPEVTPVIDAHREANGGDILLHVLLGDLARFAIAAHERGDQEVAGRLLTQIDGDLREGDAAVEDAICVSFVEALGRGTPGCAPSSKRGRRRCGRKPSTGAARGRCRSGEPDPSIR
jgi:hypothetical protein